MTMRRYLPLLAPLALAGCTNPDSVLFVTNSSVGIDVGQAPPVASIAYDYTAAFIGPRENTGATPPVVGSVQTGGTIFSPRIRQVYATGIAAVTVTDTATGVQVPTTTKTGRKTMFFGTSTTLGLKVDFTANGLPSGLVLGYKRREASYIPLAPTPDNINDAYPSTLGSISVNVSTPSMTATGLESENFFATGQAAVNLAELPRIRQTFQGLSSNALAASLTPEQMAEARQAATEQTAAQASAVGKIIDAVSSAPGTIDTAKLKAAYTQANAASPGALPPILQTTTTSIGIQQALRGKPNAVSALCSALGLGCP